MTIDEKKKTLEKEGYFDIEYIGDDIFECKYHGKTYKNGDYLETIYVTDEGAVLPAPR